jgi:hypothetical protein
MRLRRDAENLKQITISGVMKDVMRTRMNMPWPVLNPAYKEFQRLPELSLLKAFEEDNSRTRPALDVANPSEVSKLRQYGQNAGRVFASSA